AILLSLRRRPLTSTLFPYTTLFRSRSKVATIGNFWVDMTRATLYVLLPLAILVALAFVAMGQPQTLDASVTATTLEGANQVIARSEEHTSELQSRENLVCRLLLEKK